MENEEQISRIFENVPGATLAYKLVDFIDGWSRKYSIWPIHLVTGCCSPEFMQVSGARFDMERLGVLPFASVRQCNCIMVVGIVYDQIGQRFVDIDIGVREQYDGLLDGMRELGLGESPEWKKKRNYLSAPTEVHFSVTDVPSAESSNITPPLVNSRSTALVTYTHPSL